MITTLRCRQPVAYRAKNDEGTGLPARCARPAGHPGDKHLSGYAWENELERSRRKRKARKMSLPPATVSP